MLLLRQQPRHFGFQWEVTVGQLMASEVQVQMSHSLFISLCYYLSLRLEQLCTLESTSFCHRFLSFLDFSFPNLRIKMFLNFENELVSKCFIIIIISILLFVYVCLSASILCYIKMGQPGSLLRLLSVFSIKQCTILHQINVKNVHPVSRAGNRTHNLLIMSFLP